jgi:transposase InsO family protein
VAIDGLGKGKGLNSARYIKYVLDGPLKRCVQAHRRARWRDVIVLEDNAPCHSSKATDAARQNLGITSLKHPSNSPDLNAIENLWDQVKLKLGRMNRRATSLDELWEQIQQAWDEIDIGSVNRVVDSMEERRRDVVAAKGSYTRF